ncbi:MAG: hypothetical protein NXI10_12500 [bacterium]|nr:hypothetical protein [bacterium]
MMRLLLLMFTLGTFSTGYSQNWNELANYSGGPMDDGCSFTIDNIAYCGSGRDSLFNVSADFYAFNFATEQWSEIGALPFSMRRQYATADTYNSEGYVFGGINQEGEYLKDLWRYTPAGNTWDYLGQAPFEGRAGMQSFVIEDTLYIVGGRTATSDAVNDVWAYDFTTSTWTAKNDMPNDGIWRGFGAVYNGTGIVGLGSDSTFTKRGEVFFYDASQDSWTEMVALETEPMSYPAASVINDRLLIYGGIDTLDVIRNDFRYLDLTNLAWNSLNSFPDVARRGVMTFSSSSDFYISTGLTTTERLDETWVARDVANLEEVIAGVKLNVRVENGVLYLFDDVSDCYLYNSLGAEVPLIPMSAGVYQLPAGLPAGIYFCQAMKNGQLSSGKIHIQ